MTDAEKNKVRNYKACFLTDAGKKVLEDLEQRCLFKRDIYNPNSERDTCYNLGSNWVIRYIHGWIERNPDEPELTTVVHKPFSLEKRSE